MMARLLLLLAVCWSAVFLVVSGEEGGREVCEFCDLGLPPSKPGFDLAPLIQQPGVTTFTCQDLEAARLLMKQDAPDCAQIQLLKPFCCDDDSNSNNNDSTSNTSGAADTPTEGDIQLDDSDNDAEPKCQICEIAMPDPNLQLNDFEAIGIPQGTTCGFMEQIFNTTVAEFSLACTNSRNYIGFACGCVEETVYLNADTRLQKAALAWFPLGTGILSTCGSCYILWSILIAKKRTSSTTASASTTACSCISSPAGTREQFLLGMSIFDIFSSVSTSFSTLPVPKYLPYGAPTGVYGAMGNEATCKAQGFFIVLGHTSLYYNMLLAIYYLLVIRYGWREHRIKKISKYLHAIPLWGIAGAFIGIPHMSNAYVGCSIAPPPLALETWPVWSLVVAPISTVLFVATACIISAYSAVRSQERRSRRYRFPTTSNRSLTASNESSRDWAAASSQRREENPIHREFFWQSLAYLVALYLSFSMVLAMNLMVLIGRGAAKTSQIPYGVWLYFVMIGNLQGFSNFIVYVRPRVSLWWRLRQQERRRQQNRSNAMSEPASRPAAPESAASGSKVLASDSASKILKSKNDTDQDKHDLREAPSPLSTDS